MNTKNSSKNSLLIAIICCLAAIIIILVVYMLTNTNNNMKQEQTATQSEEEIKYQQASKLYENGMYEDAANIYMQISTYNDSLDKYYIALYDLADKKMKMKEYDTAKEYFTKISGYSDSDDKINECDYRYAIDLYSDKKYKDAVEIFEKLDQYSEAQTYYNKCKKAIEKANTVLDVGYVVNDSVEEENNKMYHNGDGTLKFASEIPITDWVGFGGRYVTYCEPQSYIHFKLKNTGDKPLKNLTMRLDFDGVFLENVDGDFVGDNHVHGLGGYASAVLSLYDGIQPGTNQEYLFGMHEAYFENGSSGKLRITVSADNYKARVYTVNLKLKK